MILNQFYNTPPGERGFIWILDNLIQLVRNDARNTDNYATEHDLLFGELAYLLNEGYLTVTLDTYDLPPFEHRKQKFKELYEQLGGTVEQDAALEAISKNSKYFDDVFMQYILWGKLEKIGARNINFNHKQCALFAMDIQAIVTMGDMDIEFLFEALEKGIQHVYIAHYTRQTTAKVFILRPTKDLPSYFEKKNREQQKINHFFAKIKTSNETEMYREISMYEDEHLYQLDLVEFALEDNIYRGQVVSELDNGLDGYETAVQLVQDTAFKFHESKFTIMFKSNELLVNAVLIKRPLLKGGIEEFEYYIINKMDIKTLIPYDYLTWVDQILCTFMWLSPGNTLKMEYIGTDESKDIHTPTVYDPATHTLKIAVVNLINHGMFHFFYNRIHPFDTFEKALAHEVGHVDVLVELVAHYNDVLKELRGINVQINSNINIIKEDYTKHLDLVAETMMLIDEKINLLQDFYCDKLTDVQHAYENGLQYVAPHLSYSFQKDAFRSYQQNKEKYARKLYQLYNQRYTLEKIIHL